MISGDSTGEQKSKCAGPTVSVTVNESKRRSVVRRRAGGGAGEKLESTLWTEVDEMGCGRCPDYSMLNRTGNS